MKKKVIPFRSLCQGLPRPVQCIVKFALWIVVVMPVFIGFDILRLLAIWAHDLGEWLLTIVVDEDECWTRNWWQLRKQI